MATIGERLSEARKNFGIDIRSASEATKIRSDFLEALEDNQPERIRLADVYRIGFLRIYAKYLKLDADRLVAEFRNELSFKSTPPRGGHRLVPAEISSSADGGSVFSDANKGGFSLKDFWRSGGEKRTVALVAVAAVLIAAGIFGGVKFFGGNAAGGESSAAAGTAPVAPTPATQVYEFQIVSKIAQNVVITDRYGEDEDARAVLLNGPVSPNVPQTLTGRGVLEIRDAGGSNLEIRFPARAALLASTNAGAPVRLTDDDKSKTALSSTGDWWTADPYSEARP